MIEMNGCKVFEENDELPELSDGLSDKVRVMSRYGFKINDQKGPPTWEAATEADYRDSEAKRLGIAPEDVKSASSCFQVGPRLCSGSCAGAGHCRLVYSPVQRYYYCACT